MFFDFFPDKDNGKYFYLYGGHDPDRDERVFYKFNLKGELLNVLHTKKKLYIRTKRHGLFYGITGEGISILKVKEEK